jgi:hypothetical protein
MRIGRSAHQSNEAVSTNLGGGVDSFTSTTVLWQPSAMTDARHFLIAKLRQIIDGGDITNAELDAAMIDPTVLGGAERKAWHGLSYWADDSDIRARDSSYAPSRRRQLADLLDDLETDL